MEPLRILTATLLLILNTGLCSASLQALSVPQSPSSHKDNQQDDTILTRRRRFLKPKAGGRLITFFSAVIPIEDAVWPFTIDYPYTILLDDITSGRKRKRRGLLAHEEMRYEFITNMERFLSQSVPKWLDVHACTLRTMCEVASTPLHDDGFFGQVLNALLLPEHLLELISPDHSESDYVTAQRVGRDNMECSEYHKKCPFGLFEFDDGTDSYHMLDDDDEETSDFDCLRSSSSSNCTRLNEIPDIMI